VNNVQIRAKSCLDHHAERSQVILSKLACIHLFDYAQDVSNIALVKVNLGADRRAKDITSFFAEYRFWPGALAEKDPSPLEASSACIIVRHE
jgi:hypothetical protein